MFGALKPSFRSLATQTCSEFCRRTLNQNEQLRHRAVSLRQQAFLFLIVTDYEVIKLFIGYLAIYIRPYSIALCYIILSRDVALYCTGTAALLSL